MGIEVGSLRELWVGALCPSVTKKFCSLECANIDPDRMRATISSSFSFLVLFLFRQGPGGSEEKD